MSVRCMHWWCLWSDDPLKQPVACGALCVVLQKLEKHYVPLNELVRNHWHGLILQTGYEACESEAGSNARCGLRPTDRSCISCVTSSRGSR